MLLPALLAVVLALVLAVTAPAAHALVQDKPYRDYVADSWGVEQGLPQVSVLAITQDAAGYMWFGTQGGLSRFDGSRFFRYTQADARELGSHVQALQGDDRGRVWVGTSQGLLVLDGGRFQRVPAPAGGPFPVRALAWSGEGLLVASSDGVHAVRRGQLQRLHALSAPALSLLPRADGLWIGSVGQVLRVGAAGTDALPLPAEARAAQVTGLAEHANAVWAGTSQGLFRHAGGHWQRVERGPDATAPVEALRADRDGNLWVATPQHLERLRAGQPPELIQGAPGGHAIRAIFEDRDGSLWLGSMVDGVTRLWNGWTRRLAVPEGLRNPLLWSITRGADGQVWVGGSDGVDVWDGHRFQRRAHGADLPHPEAYSLLVEPGTTWIGTRSGAAVLRDGQVQTPPLLAPLQGAQVNGIVRDRTGRLWFATTAGLFMLATDGGLHRYGEREGLADARIRLVHETRAGRILLGTYSGLYEWVDGRIVALGRKTGLADDTMVSAFLELEDGRWVLGSTQGEDLRVHDGRRWHRIGRARNLPANIAFFLAQSDGQLWVSGMRGIYRLPLAELDRALADPDRPVSATMVINSGADRPGGQQDKCCNGAGNSRGLLRDGTLWLPTRDGVLLVDTRTPMSTAPPAQVRIERLHAQGRWLRAVPGVPLRLPPGARDLRLEFTVPAFQPMHAPRLRYRLVGYEQAWRELDDAAVRTASYTNLPPGRYTFEVTDAARAQAEPARIALDIPPRLHETLGFRLVLLVLACGIPWLGYLWLQQRHARQRARLEGLVQERTRDLQAANARLEALSFTDPLTGLHNRRYLARQVPADLSFYARDPAFHCGDEAVVFALVDVDHFKAINDTHGHAAGDRVLVQLADVLGDLVRKGDYVARWGGEEFLLVLRPSPRDGLAAIGQRLCSEVAACRFELGNGVQHRLTVSAGLIECPLFRQAPGLLGWEQLVTLADRALYRAKHSGRNTWFAYRPGPGPAPAADAPPLEGDPWRLVEDGRLQMFGRDGAVDVAV